MANDQGTEYEKIQQLMSLPETQNRLHDACYKTNNRYAYKYDLKGKPDPKEIKYYNFTHTVDPWCLYCNKKNCTLKCSKCKIIYFCNAECQKKAWPIHKKHCGRNLFTVCILCGTADDITFKCKNCPVKFCSKDCYDKIHIEHEEIECDIFSKLFGVSENINYEPVVC